MIRLLSGKVGKIEDSDSDGVSITDTLVREDCGCPLLSFEKTRKLLPFEKEVSWFMEITTERPGFEPEGRLTPSNCLAGSCVQPLRHLSKSYIRILDGLFEIKYFL